MKELFYSDLKRELDKTLGNDIKVIMEDINGHIREEQAYMANPMIIEIVIYFATTNNMIRISLTK